MSYKRSSDQLRGVRAGSGSDQVSRRDRGDVGFKARDRAAVLQVGVPQVVPSIKMLLLKITSASLLLVSSMLAASKAVGQPKSKATDRSTLRTRFIAAFGSDFDLIKDQMNARTIERGGGIFWLAFVKPRRPGHFSLQYRYRDSELREIREHELGFRVAPEGCRRGTPESRSYIRFCLGDTIILPVLVNSYSNHQFKLAKAEYGDGVEGSGNRDLEVPSFDKSEITNPAAPMVQYLGRSSHRLYHRIPGYTLGLSAQFEAQEPGRMNLFVTAEGELSIRGRGFNGVPIIVLPRHVPATFIAGREEVRSYRRGADGREEVASWSSNLYMTSVLILQPGDRLSVSYYSIVRDSDYVRGKFGENGVDPSQNLKPVISVRPFAPDLEYEFTDWIVDYLPKATG